MNTMVSIIIPCYNQAHYLGEALASVLAQTYTNWECIIVNDGSPDNTKNVALEWNKRDSRITYVEQKNGGLSNARNAGIKISKGIYILPLDADDIIDSRFIEQLLPIISQQDSIAVVSCYSNFFQKTKTNIIHQLKPISGTYKNLLFQNVLVATSIYRKSSWVEVGGYDENMKSGFEDWEFWLAILKNGGTYKIVQEFLFYYRKAKNSMLVDTIHNHTEANKEYIYKKHKALYIKHFDNCISVLFYQMKTHRVSEMKLKNSLEIKIGKLILKPFRFFKRKRH